MVLVPSKRYMNIQATWTPSGGSPVTLDGLTGYSYSDNMEPLRQSADFDSFPTVIGVPYSDPTIGLNSIDAFQLSATVAGQLGTLVLTVRDFANGSAPGGGAKILTLTGASLVGRTVQGQHRQLATQDLTFAGSSSDGATSPLSIAAA